MTRRLLGFLAVTGLAASALLTVACGGGDGDNGDETSTPQATQTRGARTPTVEAQVTLGVESPTAGSTPTVAPPQPEATQPQVVATQPPAPPTQPPAPPPTQPPPPPPPPQPVSLFIVARDLAFSPTSLSAPAGSTVTVTLDNQDPGVAHDFTLYDSGGTQIAATATFTGPGQQSTTFTVGGAGRYPFTCTVHPQQMRGSLTVQ